MTDFSKRYLAEVGRRLHHEGFRIWPEHEGLLLVEKDARQVCTVNIRGSMGYDPDYVRQNGLEDILEQVRMITRETNTYMHLMEQAPPLLAEGLTGDYRLLAEFNGAVLAGHQTEYGLQFITWERVHDRSLWQGHYYDNDFGTAKQDFATRSGLVPVNTLFTKEQLAVIYDAVQNMTALDLVSNPEQGKLLERIMEQLQEAVPQVIDLANVLTQSPKPQRLEGMQQY